RTRPLSALRPTFNDPELGNEKAAFAAAPIKVEEAYATPPQHQNPIELYSTTCVWSGERLTIHEPSAAVNMLKHGVAVQLGLAPDTIEVVSPYLGGMFGSKVTVTPRTAVVALAARDLGRTVKCVTTRAQGFTNAMNRAETRHRVRLSCGADGKLASYGHVGTELTSRTDMWAVNGTGTSALMYAWPAIDTRVLMAQADRNSTGFMRAPAETPYSFAVEVAMDELAEKAGIDPVEFRRTNDVQTSTFEPKAFTSRSLIECMDRGAAAFGWSARDPRPSSMRDGDWLIGYGMAMAYYPAGSMSTAIRLRVGPDGAALVQLSAHDIGQGTYTLLAAHAAEELGLDVGKVRVELGDTRLPPGGFVGGSVGTATYCNALAQACSNLRVRLGVAPGASIMTRMTGGGAVEEHLEWTPPGVDPAEGIAGNRVGLPGFAGGSSGKKLRFAFGAEFVEVRVHDRTREIRVPRITGAFAAGRIMNARTARSQLMGGMIWGISSALHEAAEIDRRTAKYTNDNLAEYLIPVNADAPAVEVIMIPEEDSEVNALGIKGVAELGNVGTAAAISNAVYHATGMRVRDLPIRIENLLPPPPAAKARDDRRS
ncbi:MAG: xanthine dehydrogenase family protein molybdopterin-binding subunit, partial [Gemmatimonadaceae bacterium]|nr:xanthine dehydrogenase family protein molybdopterin-binding subunit [Acetobacteraceae bacterium]